MKSNVFLIIFVVLATFAAILLGMNPASLLLIIPLHLIIVKQNKYKITIIALIINVLLLLFIYGIYSFYIVYIYLFILVVFFIVKYSKSLITDISILTVYNTILNILSFKFAEKVYKIDILDQVYKLIDKIAANYSLLLNGQINTQTISLIYKQIFPSILISISVFISIFYYYVLKILCERLKIKEKEFVPFSHFIIPKEVFYAMVATFLLQFIYKDSELFTIVMNNSLFILSSVIMVQSISLFYFFFARRLKQFILKLLILIVITLLSLSLAEMAILIGMMDIIFDFAKRNKKRVRSGEG